MKTYSISYNNLDETWEIFECDESVPIDNGTGLNNVVVDRRPTISYGEEKDYFVYIKRETLQAAFDEGSKLIEAELQ